MWSLVFALVLPLGGCAGAPPNPDVVEKSVVARAGKSKYDGEPVTSSSIAIYLAELALREKGVEGGDRNVMVSFCDGIYTVTFERPPEKVLDHDYVVSIDAATSRVVEVVTGGE